MRREKMAKELRSSRDANTLASFSSVKEETESRQRARGERERESEEEVAKNRFFLNFQLFCSL